jgi:hypothetical protein
MKKFFAILVALTLVAPATMGCGDTKKKTEVKKTVVDDKDKDADTTTTTTTDTKTTKQSGDDETSPNK